MSANLVATSSLNCFIVEEKPMYNKPFIQLCLIIEKSLRKNLNTMSQHKLARYICWIPLLLLLLSQPLLAQTSLPACTAEIADVDGDDTNDNDGADGIIDIDSASTS